MRQKTAVHTLRLKAFFCSALRIDAFSFLLIYFKRYEIEKGCERRVDGYAFISCKKFKRNTLLRTQKLPAKRGQRKGQREISSISEVSKHF